MTPKQEQELELAMWQARAESAQNAVAALNAQAQLINYQAKEVQGQAKEARDNIERLQGLLKADGGTSATDQEKPGAAPAT